MSIGENIKKYRKGKLTQEELGTQIGKTERTIRGYENGDTSPSMEILKSISVVLDVPLINLIEDTNEDTDNISIAEIEEIKKQPFNKLPPSAEKRLKLMSSEQSEMVVNLIKCVNYWYCDNRYDLEKIIVGDAGVDISDLLIDIVKNRLIHYNNIYEKNNKK